MASTTTRRESDTLEARWAWMANCSEYLKKTYCLQQRAAGKYVRWVVNIMFETTCVGVGRLHLYMTQRPSVGTPLLARACAPCRASAWQPQMPSSAEASSSLNVAEILEHLKCLAKPPPLLLLRTLRCMPCLQVKIQVCFAHVHDNNNPVACLTAHGTSSRLCASLESSIKVLAEYVLSSPSRLR